MHRRKSHISKKLTLFSLEILVAVFATFTALTSIACGATVTPSIILTAYNADGTNTGTARLGRGTSLQATVRNSSNTAVTWALSGVGTLTQSGVYTAPSAMPSVTSATVTVTLASNTAVSASYSFTIINPAPAISSAYTAAGPLTAATTNSVTVSGAGFVPSTVLLANGSPVATTVVSSYVLTALVPVSATATGSVPLIAQNPTPGGGQSAAYPVSIAPATISLVAYNSLGTNTNTGLLGRGISIVPTIHGTANTAVTWTLQGAGSLSTAGVYTAPSAMPANPNVSITGTLVANPAVSATYSLVLQNPAPVISSAYTVAGPLSTATTNSVTVNGSGFVPSTVLLASGSPVATTVVSSYSLTALVPVSATATGSVPLIAQNPTPGGGQSAAYPVSVASATISLVAYNSLGTNTNTGLLGRGISIVPTIHGTANTAVTWTLQGAGSLSTAGVYTAPSAMPANPNVSITAALVSNPAVSATYSLVLQNPAPVISSAYTAAGPLSTATTNSVTVNGSGFVPSTVLLANGSPVATTVVSSYSLTALVPVSATATGSVPLIAQNPTPGGGQSAAYPVSISSVTLALTSYNSLGTNTRTCLVGTGDSIVPTIHGTANTAITWTLQGAGSLSNAGVYMAPAGLPANPNVSITAALVSNPSISATYSLVLQNPAPAIRWMMPEQLATGVTNAVTVGGNNFVPGSTILINGAALATTYVSNTQVTAQLPIGYNAQGSVSVTVQNSAPGGGVSPAFQEPITPLTIQLNAYNSDGTNTNTGRVGLPIQFTALVQGGSNPTLAWTETWSVQGAGTISGSGVYQAPTTMPSNPTVTVTATLQANTSVATSYTFNLLNPAPVVNGANPTRVPNGTSTSITVLGSGFVNGTTILVNGSPVTTTYQSPTAVQVTVSPSATATSLSLAAQNSTPGGGTSNSFTLQVQAGDDLAAQVTLTPGLQIPQNFLGLSQQWADAQWYMGSAATGTNYIYRQLLRNLMNNESYPLLIRVAGDPITTVPTAGSVDAFSQLSTAMGVHFDMGVNLEADNPQLATGQAQFFVGAMPAGSIDAIEIGNEPDNYVASGARPAPYNMTSYLQDFATWSADITPYLNNSIKFMATSWGSMGTLHQNFSAFEGQTEQQVSLFSQHYYGGYQEGGATFAPDYLLTPVASDSGAAAVASYVPLAHAAGQQFRIGEMNSIDGGGLEGISDTFSSALWAIDTMFEFANVGVDGVNIHGISDTIYCPFNFNTASNGQGGYAFTLAKVNPLYYGMLFFQEATVNGAKLLPVSVQSGPNVKVWATEDKQGTVRVAIVNKDETFSGNVAISLSGLGAAQVERLEASSYSSKSGITLGGQTFDGSVDGTLVGSPTAETTAPVNGVYTVGIQPTSAVLLTITN